jgi:hypothetical protein
MTLFRIYHTPMGGHVHLRVFAGDNENGLGLCGNLTMRLDEFALFKDRHQQAEELLGGIDLRVKVEFVEQASLPTRHLIMPVAPTDRL